MKLVDKLKDMFTYSVENEEEEEEVKIEHITKETPKVIKEERKEEIEPPEETEKEEIVEEKEEVKTREEKNKPEKNKTPIFFTENDFADLEPERPRKTEVKAEPKPLKREEKKLYSGSYTSTTILTKEKPTFKPTPIISPIFGVLGENYDKDEIVEKSETSKKEIKSGATDGMTHDKFDEVRNKAYGTLENELEDTIYDKKDKSSASDEIDLFDELEEQQDNNDDTASLAKTVTQQEKNIRDLEEITMDLTKELDNLLLKKESFNSKKEKVSKQIKESSESESQLTEDELFNLIDSMYEDGKE